MSSRLAERQSIESPLFVGLDSFNSVAFFVNVTHAFLVLFFTLVSADDMDCTVVYPYMKYDS